MKISIIIPAYNESENIEAHLNEIEIYINETMSSHQWEVFVVNDGSTYDTGAIVRNLELKKPWLKAINLSAHQGSGKSITNRF